MTREVDYVAEAKDMIHSGHPQLAVPYALVAIAEQLQAHTQQMLAAAAAAGAESALTAVAELYNAIGLGSTPPAPDTGPVRTWCCHTPINDPHKPMCGFSPEAGHL